MSFQHLFGPCQTNLTSSSVDYLLARRFQLSLQGPCSQDQSYLLLATHCLLRLEDPLSLPLAPLHQVECFFPNSMPSLLQIFVRGALFRHLSPSESHRLDPSFRSCA